MSRQYFSEAVAWVDADGTAVTNTTTETVIFPTVTIPANTLQYGRHVRVWAFGKYSTGTGPPTLVFSVRLGGVGGTLICKTAACTTVASVTNAGWELEAILNVRTNGSSGAVYGNGHVHLYAAVAGTVASATGEGLLTPMMNGGVVTPATATVDCTVDQALALTATWSASSTSHTVTGLQMLLELPN